MTKTIGKVLGALLSISIIVAGIGLMIQCLSIYNSGDKPYSRETVAQAFGEISVPIYICLSLIIITFFYNFFFGNVYKANLAVKNNAFIIKAITLKKDISYTDITKINKERMLRQIHSTVLTVLLILCFGCFLSYALNPANFHQSEINSSVIKAMTVFCICIVLPFTYSVICIFINDRSRRREISLIRELVKDAPTKEAKTNRSKTYVLTYIQAAAIVLCVGVIFYGLFSGGTADVLTKAINICTECIGLG